MYKELITEHGLSSNDISLTWNTDGVPVFKSSDYAIWPLQATINELPPHLRHKNIMLLGLWFGQKQNMNVFLLPFVEECSRLELRVSCSAMRSSQGRYLLCFCLLIR